MPTIEEMRQSMTEAGVYTKADIDKICELEKQYREECKEIAEQCEAEGYPANGSNVVNNKKGSKNNVRKSKTNSCNLLRL